MSLLLVGAFLAAFQHRSQLAVAGRMLPGADPGWLIAAVVAEAGSMIAFARLEHRLLQSARADVGLSPLVGITLASNAMATSLPGGVAWSATWAFGQLRRRGAERMVAGWVILVSGALASFALFVIVAVGAWVAGGRGPVANLRWLAALLAAVPILIAAGYAGARRSARIRSLEGAAWRALAAHSGAARSVGRLSRRLVDDLGQVRLGVTGWGESFGWAAVNWITDALALAAALEALHVPVPWRGFLVIYGITQISASLPVTPGGLGVVEGSMTALLVTYGTHPASALAAVLLYRIISFWGLVPVGWVAWFGLEVAARRTVTGTARRPVADVLRPAPAQPGPMVPVPARAMVRNPEPRLLPSTPALASVGADDARWAPGGSGQRAA